MKAFHLVAGLALALVPAAANAVVTAFANFSPVAGTSYNVAYDDATRTLYTTANANQNSVGTPGSVLVNFDYLQNDATLNAIGVVRANFTLVAVSTGAASTNPDTETISQGRFNGNTGARGFSFLAANDFTANGLTYAAGTNLLSGKFTNASLSAEDGDTAASFRDSTPGSANLPRTITYTSDFLDFSQTVDRSFSFNLDALAPRASQDGNSFDMFAAIIGGTLSSDPAPVVDVRAVGTPTQNSAVPEPGTWALLLAGFGVTGAAMRSSRRRRSLFA